MLPYKANVLREFLNNGSSHTKTILDILFFNKCSGSPMGK